MPSYVGIGNAGIYTLRRQHIQNVIFQNMGTSFLSGWHNATPCLLLSHLALSCMTQNKALPYMLIHWINQLVIIGLHDVFHEYHMCAMCEFNIHIHWKIMICWALLKNPDKARQGETRQDKTRWGGTQKRRCPLVLKNIIHIETNSKGDPLYQKLYLSVKPTPLNIWFWKGHSQG